MNTVRLERASSPLTRIGAKWVCAATAMSLAAVAFSAEPLDAERTRELQSFATNALGVLWEGKVQGVAERGVVAITDGGSTLTVREPAGVIILHNQRAMEKADPIGFRGSDERLKRHGAKLLDAARIDRQEVAEMKILQHFTQIGYKDPQAKSAVVQPAEKANRALLITRQIDTIPVYSSRLLLNLDRDEKIVLMELAWPPVSDKIRDEARHMRDRVARGFDAPKIEGATVESIEAGIIHSPAVAFYNDMSAVIRVVYKSEDPTIGKKAVRYLDLNRREVAMPRQIDPLKEEAVVRQAR
jgi:hypothetical protein